MTGVKQVIVIRRDLKMRRGKEIAQGAHAAMAWLVHRLEANRHYDDGGAGGAWVEGELSPAEWAWLNSGHRKITVHVPDEAALLAVADKARELGVLVHVVTDAGLTEFGGVPTVTALAIGPDWDERVDAVTANLELY